MRYLSAHYVFPVSSPPLRKGIICVNDDGCIIDVMNTGGKLEAREKLEFYNGILVPGFVNAHCHLELSHLRNVIHPHGGLPDFILSVGKVRRASDEIIMAAAKAADEKMTGNGVVAVGDISNNACTLPIKRNSAMWYRTFIEVFGLDDRRSEEIFTAAKQVEQEYRRAGMPVSIVPHAIYSVSQVLWKTLHQSYVLSPPQVISMHHQESSEEMDVFWEGKGELADMFRKNGLLTDPKPKTRTANRKIDEANPSAKSNLNGESHDRRSQTRNKEMIDCLQEASRCLLVHNTFSTKDDLAKYILQPGQYYFVLCPRSNLFIQDRLPDLLLFSVQKLCQNICLGTDSFASNTSLSILEEMKIIQQHATEISFDMLLQWATLNGAKALGFDHLLGSFEKGKVPGINLITRIDYENQRLTAGSTVKPLI